MRRVAVVLIAALSCSKSQPKADSVAFEAVAVGASAAAVGASAAAAPSTQLATAAPRPTGSASTTKKSPSTGDVIIGRVDEHGFDPATFIAITPASGAQVRVSGSQIAALGKVKGADVWAQGRQDTEGFVVDTFEVRQVNNRPVEDGIVSVSGSTVTVRTARATVIYPDAPTALRDATGARVWITPPVAGQAPSFGIIRTTTKQLRR